MPLKVIVTGATGFIGRHLVATLLRRGHEVVAVSRGRARADSLKWRGDVDRVEVDVHHPDAADVLGSKGADAVAHLAWPGLPNYYKLYHFEENLPRSYHFLKGLVERGCGQVLVAGTCLEFGVQCGGLAEDDDTRPVTAYGLAKDTLRRFLQELVREVPFTLQWARIFYTYGEGQNPNSLIAQLDGAIDRGEPRFNMSGGEQLRDYQPVERVVEMMAVLLEQRQLSGNFNCCSGVPVSVRTMVEGRLRERGATMELNCGYYPYSPHEPMAYWGLNRSNGWESILENLRD